LLDGFAADPDDWAGQVVVTHRILEEADCQYKCVPGWPLSRGWMAITVAVR